MNFFQRSGYNCRPKSERDQVFYKETFEPLRPAVTIEDIKDLTPTERRTLNNLLYLSNTCEVIGPSQNKWLAKKAGTRRETVNRAISKITKLGFIIKKRNYNRACYYRINPFFFADDIRKLLAPYLPALSYLPLVLLTLAYNTISASQDYITLKTLNPKSFSFLREYLYTSCRKRDLQLRDSQSKYGIWDDRRQKNKNFGKSSKFSNRSNAPFNGVNATFNRSSASMEQFKQDFSECKDSPIPEYIRAIKGLKLTKWGQIKLSAFPRGAVLHLDRKITSTKALRDPFGYAYRICLEWCKENNIQPDFKWANRLLEQYAMPTDAPMLLATDRKLVSAPRTHSPQSAIEKPAVRTRDEQKIYYQSEIEKCQEILRRGEQDLLPAFLRQSSITFAKSRLQECQNGLLLLMSSEQEKE